MVFEPMGQAHNPVGVRVLLHVCDRRAPQCAHPVRDMQGERAVLCGRFGAAALGADGVELSSCTAEAGAAKAAAASCPGTALSNGTRALTSKPPERRGPLVTVPPTASMRSRMPMRP